MVGQERLSTKVTGIINRIEQDLDSVDSKIGEAMHVLDLDNDGLVRLLGRLRVACAHEYLIACMHVLKLDYDRLVCLLICLLARAC